MLNYPSMKKNINPTIVFNTPCFQFVQKIP